MPLQDRFGRNFVGRLWSCAAQDELPFEVVQKLLPGIAFPEIFADFACSCVRSVAMPV